MHIKKVKLPIIKAKAYFKSRDLFALETLLRSDVDLKNALLLIKTKQNKGIVEELIQKLDHGVLLEEIFPEFLKSDVRSYFLALAPYLSLLENLYLTLKLFKEKKALESSIQKALVYPLGMLFLSLAGVYLFNSFCFDGLLNAFSSLSSNLNGLEVFKEILDFTISLIFILILLILGLLLYFSRPKRQVLAYVFLCKYLSFSVLKDYLSNEFMIYFKECQALGIKTYDTINILKHLKEKPLITFLAHEVDRALLRGDDLKGAMSQPFIDERLAYFIKIASSSVDSFGMIDLYLNDFKARFSRFCLKLAKIIQISAYALVGILIIFVYQILFIPMSMLGGI